MKYLIALFFATLLTVGFVRAAEDDERIDQLEKKVGILTEEIERLRLGRVAEPELESVYGLGPAASKVYHVGKGVSIAGYGEMVYQNFSDEKEDGSDSGKIDQLDFLRAILYTGYKFNDRILFNSEIEFEHASTEGHGEVSVEFAYLDFNIWRSHGIRAGMLLVPVGLVNEKHEPVLFFGANRPSVAKNIVPTTWRENGAGIYGEIGPLVYRSYILAGLDSKGFRADKGIREGRQHGSKSKIDDFAWTARLDYIGLPGLLAGVSTFIGDSGQGKKDSSGNEVDGTVTLWDLHAQYEWNALVAKAVYAQITIDDVLQINDDLGLTGSNSVGEKLYGGYFVVAYDILSLLGSDQSLSPFFRFERYDTQAEVPSGFSRDPANNRTEFTYGVNYKPMDNLVLKLDYQDKDNKADTGINQLNLAIGYVF